MIFLRLLNPTGIDFPQFFDASVMFLHKLNFYQYLLTSPGPFNYPPSSFLFLWWLGLLPYNLAGTVWNIASLASLMLSIWLILKLASRKVHLGIYILLIFLFTIPFFPVKHNLASGQINNFILLFSVLSLYFYQKNRKSLSAVFLAYATGIKLVPVIFILYFIIKRDWLQVVRFLISLATLFLLPFLFISWQYQNIYYTKVFFQAWPLAGKDLYYNQSLLGFLTRSFHTEFVIKIFQYGLSSTLVVLTIFRGKKLNTVRLLSAIACLYLILNPLAWQHHFVFAIVPLILLASDIGLSKAKYQLWLPIIIGYILISWNIKQPNLVPKQFNFLLSHQFFGALTLWIFALWKENFWKAASILWITLTISSYLLLLLCHAKICF